MPWFFVKDTNTYMYLNASIQHPTFDSFPFSALEFLLKHRYSFGKEKFKK